MTHSASFDNLYRKIINEKKIVLKKFVFSYNIHKKTGDLNGYYNYKSKIESKY